jgi:hypothetical protein
MRKLCRHGIFCALALFSLQPAALVVPVAFASTAPAPASSAKKKNKGHKIRYRKKILKGHHGKHTTGKPA